MIWEYRNVQIFEVKFNGRKNEIEIFVTVTKIETGFREINFCVDAIYNNR